MVGRHIIQCEVDVAAWSRRRGGGERGQGQPGVGDVTGGLDRGVGVSFRCPWRMQDRCAREPDQGDTTTGFTSQATHNN